MLLHPPAIPSPPPPKHPTPIHAPPYNAGLVAGVAALINEADAGAQQGVAQSIGFVWSVWLQRRPPCPNPLAQLRGRF